MSEYKRPRNSEEFNLNFAQKKPLMNTTEAYYESSRCLFCYDAPCIEACPSDIDIPLFIKQIQTKNTIGSAKTIYEKNWMGNACGKVCPTEVLCEGACVYNHQNVPPIQIGRLQNFATDKAITQKANIFKAGKDNGKKVAIIGAGPAGLACACELRTMGYKVDIYEANEKATGLTVYGVAPYKLTNEEALDELDYLQSMLGFNILYNKRISNAEDLSAIESNYDAVFLGIGMGGTRNLSIPGENNPHVVGAVEFIEELRMKQYEVEVPYLVVVLGGGNTAMDAASEAARMGAKKVVLAYRRSKERMSAYGFEYKLALSAGVESMFNVAPVEIICDADQVKGVKFIKTQNLDGKLEHIKGSEFIQACDMVIKATGQSKQADFLSIIDGLTIDERNCIKVDLASYQTTNPKYFAGGDAVNGGAEVVNAAYEGKQAAYGIDNWLNS